MPVRGANAAIAADRLDLALYYHPGSDARVRVERLGTITSSVYCGRGHPLFRKRRVTRAELLAHTFSAPPADESGAAMDDWPAQVPRLVALTVGAVATNVEVARSGKLLAVLPDAAAAQFVRAGALRRIDGRLVPPTSVFAAYAPDTDGQPYFAALLAALRKRFPG